MTALASVVPELSLGTVPDQVIANPIGVAAVGNPVESPVGLALTILLVVLRRRPSGRW